LAYELRFSTTAARQLRKLDRTEASRIVRLPRGCGGTRQPHSSGQEPDRRIQWHLALQNRQLSRPLRYIQGCPENPGPGDWPPLKKLQMNWISNKPDHHSFRCASHTARHSRTLRCTSALSQTSLNQTSAVSIRTSESPRVFRRLDCLSQAAA